MGFIDGGPLDLNEEDQPSEWAKVLKKAQAGTQAVMGTGTPMPGAPAAAAPGAPGAPPNTPALIEQPKLAQPTPSTSTASPLAGSPLDLNPADAHGVSDSSAIPGNEPQPKAQAGYDPRIPTPKAKPTPFQSFLSTMRDVATGHKSPEGSIAGDVRGGFRHLSDTLANASIAIGGPELMLRQKEADANRELARTQFAGLQSYRQDQTRIAGQKADTAETKAAQSDLIPLSDEEADRYNMPHGTKLNQAQYGSLAKTGATLESKESEGALNRDMQLEKAEMTTHYKTTPAGLFDTKTGKMLPSTGGKTLITKEVAADYGLNDAFIGSLMTPGEAAQNRRAQSMFAPTVTSGTNYVPDVSGQPVAMPHYGSSQKIMPGTRSPQVPLTETPPYNPQAGAPEAPPAPAAPWNGGTGAPGTQTPAPRPAAPRGKGGQPAPGTPLAGVQLKAPKMLMATSLEGKQIAGTPAQLKAAGVDLAEANELPTAEVAKLNTARQMTAPGGLFDLINKDLAKISDKDMTVLGSRWQEFRRGTWGSGDLRFAKLYTHVKGLLATAVAQVHVGANGSQEMMEHFSRIADSTFMDKKTLQASLEGEKEYLDDKAMRPVKAGTNGGGPSPMPKKGDVVDGFTFQGGDPNAQKNWKQ